MKCMNHCFNKSMTTNCCYLKQETVLSSHVVGQTKEQLVISLFSWHLSLFGLHYKATSSMLGYQLNYRVKSYRLQNTCILLGSAIWNCITIDNNVSVSFYRATACNATHGIAVEILSICPSVCPSDACIVTKLNDALWIFWYHTKRQSL